MADISAELQAIMDAVYGEEVRGSIHDAIQKINTINDTGIAEINEVAVEALSALSQARSAVNGWPRMAVIDYTTGSDYELTEQMPGIPTDIDIDCDAGNVGHLDIYGDEDLIRHYSFYERDDDNVVVMLPLHTDITFWNHSCSFRSTNTRRTNIDINYPNNTLGDPNLIFFDLVHFEIKDFNHTGSNQIHFQTTLYNRTGTTFQNTSVRFLWEELICLIPKSIIDTNESLREFVERIGAVKIKAGVGESAVIENDIENNTAGGDYAHAEGGLTIASGDYAHAEGTGYDANGDSENDQPNVASGRASHVEGYRTEASGDYSHAEGRSTTASANYAHAEGYNNTASGSGAHAEGQATHAEGDFSHAEGNSASATGSNSHAEGFGTIASGFSSHAEGDSTIALCRSQHVGGEYNTPDPDDDNNEYTKGRYIEIQGNGTSNSNRSNARTLDWEGTEWLAKSLELGPNHDELTPERVRMIDNVVETLKAVSDTRIVSGPTAEFSDAQAGMPITHLEGEIIFDTEQDGSFTGKTSITLTEQHNEDTPVTHTVTFPEGSSPVFGGYFDFPTGKLYITMISSSMKWGDMQFSIDPDNYLGKRIPLPNCVCGFSGEGKTFCNLTDTYIYDQSASTHFYVYRDDETTGYAVVVLPDVVPDDTVIQVVGTLVEPIVIDLDTYLLVTSAGDNSYSVDTGDILKCEYVHDVASQEYDELDARIDAIRQLPAYPDSDGSYILKLTIADGDPTLSWIPEN